MMHLGLIRQLAGIMRDDKVSVLIPELVVFHRVERSTDQVIKPVNVEALSKWVGKIPVDVLRDMSAIAPMLARLGYDPHANPPNYGRPDPHVLDNTRRVSAYTYQKPYCTDTLLNQHKYI